MSLLATLWIVLGLIVTPSQVVAESTPPRARFEFTTFGSTKALARATRIAEARVDAIYDLPIGTSVVRFKSIEQLFPADESQPPKSFTVIAARNAFHAGVDYVLFLVPYRQGGRYVSVARLANADRDYEAKKSVVRQYIDVDRIEDPAEREHRIIDLLISNLAAREEFVRQNALQELTALRELLPDALGPKERARIVAIAQVERTDKFRAALEKLLEACGVVIERTKQG